MSANLGWVLAGMVVVTYGIRLSFLVFGHGLSFPHWMERALRYVPAAVLTAIIVPMALAPQGSVDVSWHNAYLPGAVVAGVVAMLSRHTLGAILSSFLAYGCWRFFLA